MAADTDGNTATDVACFNHADFYLGTGASTVAVTGNLTINSTLNINNTAGFAASNYTLFTYTGALSGSLFLGPRPRDSKVIVTRWTPQRPVKSCSMLLRHPPPNINNVNLDGRN